MKVVDRIHTLCFKDEQGARRVHCKSTRSLRIALQAYANARFSREEKETIRQMKWNEVTTWKERDPRFFHYTVWTKRIL